MLAKVKVQERTLRLESDGGRERTVTFPAAIVQTLGFADVIVVRLEPDPYLVQDRNVFGVTVTPSEVWRVDPSLRGCVCVALAVEAGRLIASLEDGRQVALDPLSGRLF